MRGLWYDIFINFVDNAKWCSFIFKTDNLYDHIQTPDGLYEMGIVAAQQCFLSRDMRELANESILSIYHRVEGIVLCNMVGNCILKR